MQNNGIPIAKKGKVESSLCIHRAFHPWVLTPLAVGSLSLWILHLQIRPTKDGVFLQQWEETLSTLALLQGFIIICFEYLHNGKEAPWIPQCTVLPAEPFPTKGKQIDETNEGWSPSPG